MKFDISFARSTASAPVWAAELDAQLAQAELDLWGTNDRIPPEELDPREVWWRERFQQLKGRGYLLRPRYSPEWVPSWTISGEDWEECEDRKRIEYGQLMDATRISDGRDVALKSINREYHPYEADIAMYLSSELLASEPGNHSVLVYEVFTLDNDDNTIIMVMPLLRPCDDPRFDTIGEAVECFRQLFEGLHFMHKHHVAHRDCMGRNIMVDPTHLYPKSFHPVDIKMNKSCKARAKHFTRTQRPPKYYFIDFGLSRRYDPSNANPRETPIWGGYKNVPEFQKSNAPCDPFATDVFYIGYFIYRDFILNKKGFKFMAPLVATMVQEDPAKRPKMDEVVTRFDDILRGLKSKTLRSRVIPVDEDAYERVTRSVGHWARRMRFVATRAPALPTPPSKEVVALDPELCQKAFGVFGTTGQLVPEKLDSREIWWRDHYQQLKSRGYLLRPRYAPDWIPSWTASNRDWDDCEDSKRLVLSHIIDATRSSDGKAVTLKRISRKEHPYEIEIGLYFSSEALASQASNHCVPIYEVFNLDDDDELAVVVMPRLRAYTDPHFETMGEAVECFRQLFEGLQFMHRHHVAHRDCMTLNIMLDPTHLYPKSYHPIETSLSRDCKAFAKHLTRTQRPPKYYFIDFGISRRYEPFTNPMEVPIWGGDKEVPEFQNSNAPCDPFATDVFYLGNVIRKDFILTKRGFEFMKPLVAEMIQEDPAKRPKMDEVVVRFDDIRRGLSSSMLRSRVVDIDEDRFQRVARATSHWTRHIGFVVWRVPAIPTPR